MNRIGIALAALIAALALNGIAVSSSSANLVLKCYKISKFEKEKLAGNYKNATCTEEVAALTGEFALAEPTKFRTQDLWCAKLTPAVATGSFEDEGCEKPAKDSKFVEVIVLPDVSVTLGGSYPVHAQGTLPSAATSLGTASGVALEGTGVTLLLLLSELSSLGEFTATFTKVKNPKNAKSCKTAGAAEGVVVSSGIFHVVLTPAGLALLFLPKEFEISCASLETLVKGSVLSTLVAGTETEELTKVSGKLEGNAGKQKLTEYYNDSGTISKSELLSNSGAGFVLSDENVSEELKAETLEGKMIVITGR